MNPFEFDESATLPSRQAPAPRRRRTWVVAIGAVFVVLTIITLLFVAGLGDPNASPDIAKEPQPKNAHYVAASRTAETPTPIAEPTEPTTASSETTVPKKPMLRGKSPRKMTEKEQAVLDKTLAILANPDQVTLYALYPYPWSHEHPRETFHEWKVLGKTVIHYPEPRRAVTSVADTIQAGVGARCFDPRHGVRAVSGKRSVDLVICFECSWVHIYLHDGEDQRIVLTIVRDHPELEKLLESAGVRRPLQLQEPF